MVKIFLDGADAILQNADNPDISGFTTNPTLMKEAGVISYTTFAREVLMKITDKPVAFEVLSDDFEEMYRQALIISSWGANVNVKIPVTNTKGESSRNLLRRLIDKDININVTAITLINQVLELIPILEQSRRGYISVFAGRIADTGVDPMPIMKRISWEIGQSMPQIQLIWASAREILNVNQAESAGADIITLGMNIYKKFPLYSVSLQEMSLNTVKMFYEDGQSFCIG
jgi:transaldolase